MSKAEQYRAIVTGLHLFVHNLSLDDFLTVCIERLRKEGHTFNSAMEVLHDHLELASNWKAQYKE